jgi:molybdate transport system ATP-binding protein
MKLGRRRTAKGEEATDSSGCDAFLLVQVSRRFPGFLLDVSFTAGRETVVLFGPSGGGKSMTLKAIAGILRLDVGRISIGSRVLYDSERRINVPAPQRRVGYVPQGYALFPHLRVEENIGFGLKQADGTGRAAAIREMVSLTGLTGLEGRYPRELSGGQQQRVALARALATNPDILLLDEPFSALDSAIRRALREEITALHNRTGIPTLVVTHDLSDAFDFGRRIVVLDGGRVLQQGSREDVFYRPATRRVAELVGMRNILAATVERIEGRVAVLDWGGRRLHAALADAGTTTPVGKRVDVCIRPSQIMIKRPDDDYSGRPNVLSGVIVDETVGSDQYRLFVSLPGSSAPYDLQIELSGYTYFRLGLDRTKEIEISIRPDALHIIPEGV